MEPATIEKPAELVQGALFDYASLDIEDRIRVQSCADAIRKLMRNTAQQVVEIGEYLIETKKRLGDFKFDLWLKAEFNWHVKTAFQFMIVAEKFSSLNLLEANISSSALYVLSAPSTPKEAREAAVDLAKQGVEVTQKVAKAVVKTVKETKTKEIKQAVQSLPVPAPEPEVESDGASPVEQDAPLVSEKEMIEAHKQRMAEANEEASIADQAPVLPIEYELIQGEKGWKASNIRTRHETFWYPTQEAAIKAAIELDKNREFLAPGKFAATPCNVGEQAEAAASYESPEYLSSHITITVQLFPLDKGKLPGERQTMISVRADEDTPMIAMGKAFDLHEGVFQGLIGQQLDKLKAELPKRRAEAKAKKDAAPAKPAEKAASKKPVTAKAKPAKKATAKAAKAGKK